MIQRLHQIWTLYAREMRSALRERNIVIYSIILPVLLYPGLLWLVYSGISFVTGQSESMISRVAISEIPPEHAALRNFLQAKDLVELHSQRVSPESLASGTIDVGVEFLSPSDGSSLDAETLGGAPQINLLYDGSRDRSRRAHLRMETYLTEYRQEFLINRMSEAHLEPSVIQRVWIETQNLASGNEMGRFLLGLFVPFLMLIMLAVGAVYPAIDSTAGERENATWETLMTVAAPRSSILIAKYLYVATMSFMAGMLNVVAMAVSLSIILEPLVGDTIPDFSVALPLTSIAVLALGAALMALFLSAGMMILASFARTFREGQSMFGPLYITLLMPLIFLQSPELRLNFELALLPVVNVALMFRDAIEGIYRWDLIGVTLATEILTIVLALSLAHKILAYEDFVVGRSSATLWGFLKHQFAWRRAGT